VEVLCEETLSRQEDRCRPNPKSRRETSTQDREGTSPRPFTQSGAALLLVFSPAAQDLRMGGVCPANRPSMPPHPTFSQFCMALTHMYLPGFIAYIFKFLFLK
jgi:hypothetical protein